MSVVVFIIVLSWSLSTIQLSTIVLNKYVDWPSSFYVPKNFVSANHTTFWSGLWSGAPDYCSTSEMPYTDIQGCMSNKTMYIHWIQGCMSYSRFYYIVSPWAIIQILLHSQSMYSELYCIHWWQISHHGRTRDSSGYVHWIVGNFWVIGVYSSRKTTMDGD